jgi:hypothetical protein
MGLLIKLKNGDTELKSLKYGNDRPGGGDSGQPYIKNPIQSPTTPLNQDSILRGGLEAPISAAEDVARLTKYFFDFRNPNGLLFVGKQNLLSRISPKTEASFGLGYGGASKDIDITGVVGGSFTGDISINKSNGAINAGVYTPLSTLAQAGVNFAGIHLNKQGLDPTGLIPTLSVNKYQDVIRESNKSIPEDPKVPLSLAKKASRANQKAARANSNFLNQQTKTDTELNTNFQGLNDLPFNEFNQPSRSQQIINKWLGKWDEFLDKQSLKKLEKKETAADRAIDRAESLNNQVEAAQNAPKVYTNRLLKLWNDSGLNSNNAFESISPVLYSYEGGPNSVLGAGSTDIKFATTNDGVTPLRTNVIPIDSPIRPSTEYTTLNIFGDNSVSLKYASNIEVSEEDLFGSENYLSNNSITPDPDLGLFHKKYLGVYNRFTSTFPDSTRPLVEYDLYNIFNFYNPDKYSVSLKWNALYPNTALFNDTDKDDFFSQNNSKQNTGFKTNNDGLGKPSEILGSTSFADQSGVVTLNPFQTFNQSKLEEQSINKDSVTKEDFRQTLISEGYDKSKSFISDSPDYLKYNQENRVFMGKNNDPGAKGDRSDYTKGKRDIVSGRVLGAVDLINSKPVYKSSTANTIDTNDFVQFRIGILDKDNPSQLHFTHFRSYIDNFGDSYSSKWSSQKYMGRGEEFYKYGSFSRKINIDFTVVALSKEELLPMYKKINFIASSLAPQYSFAGYMGGNIAQISLGSWLYEQPGIIESFNIKIPEESPWELAIGIDDIFKNEGAKELPHMVKISMTFTPIHRFRPEINDPDSPKFINFNRLK